MSETFKQKVERNVRIRKRYDELMRLARHGHYETMFRIIREEVENERERCAKIAENPGFIQAQDTEWDEGVNYAKNFIANAIRAQGIAEAPDPNEAPEPRRIRPFMPSRWPPDAQ